MTKDIDVGGEAVADEKWIRGGVVDLASIKSARDGLAKKLCPLCRDGKPVLWLNEGGGWLREGRWRAFHEDGYRNPFCDAEAVLERDKNEGFYRTVEHMCGLTGYNPMLGDSCPGCDCKEHKEIGGSTYAVSIIRALAEQEPSNSKKG